MSLLTIIQEISDAIGITRPTSVIASTDLQIRQLVALCNIEGKRLSGAHDWNDLQLETTFTSVAADSQGDIATLAPGFKHIINETIFNRSGSEKINGPLSPSSWQFFKANVTTGPFPEYRIRGGKLLMIPQPAAGETMAFEYQSKNWLENAAGTVTYEAWQADDDEPLVPEELLKLGTIWRFLKAKGFDYAEDFTEYQGELNQLIVDDGGSATISLSSTQQIGVLANTPDGDFG